MAYKYYFRSGLTGGTAGDLDDLDGANLIDNDAAVVVPGDGNVYHFILDADSALTEDSPRVIEPDINAGDKRWILQKTTKFMLDNREVFIQATEPTAGESTEGDLWIDIS